MQAAGRGCVRAMMELGTLYANRYRAAGLNYTSLPNSTFEKPPLKQDDIEQAIFWYSNAVKRGHRKAMIALAHLYQHQLRVDEEEQRAFDIQAVNLYKQARDFGANVLDNLIEMYTARRGVGNDTKAILEELACLQAEKLTIRPKQSNYTEKLHSGIVGYVQETQTVAPRRDIFLDSLKLLIPCAEIGMQAAIETLMNIYNGFPAGSKKLTNQAEFYWWGLWVRDERRSDLFTKPAKAVPMHDEAADLNNLRAKLQEVLGEFSLMAMYHNPEPQPSDVMQAGRLPKSPILNKIHTPILMLIEETLDLLNTLEKPGMLFNLIERKSEHQLLIPSSYIKPRFSNHVFRHDGEIYKCISIGEDNVRASMSIGQLIIGEQPSWKFAQSDLGDLRDITAAEEKKHCADYLVASGKLKALQREEDNLKSLPSRASHQEKKLEYLSLQKRMELEVELELISKAQEETSRRREYVHAVENLPHEIETVIYNHLGVRNRLTKEKYPWIDEGL